MLVLAKDAKKAKYREVTLSITCLWLFNAFAGGLHQQSSRAVGDERFGTFERTNQSKGYQLLPYLCRKSNLLTVTITLTLILVALNVIISFYAFEKPIVLNRLMMNPWNIKRKNQYERFITSGFIHKDHMHLIFNMISLYFLGGAVESDFIILFGSKGYFYYFLLYMLAIVASDLPTYFKNQNNPSYNSLGASGGVAAVVFAFIILEPVQYLCVFIGLCMPGFIFGSIYLIYSYFQGKRANDNINHDAHIYGSLFGLVFCVIIYPASISHFFYQVNQWLSTIL